MFPVLKLPSQCRSGTSATPSSKQRVDRGEVLGRGRLYFRSPRPGTTLKGCRQVGASYSGGATPGGTKSGGRGPPAGNRRTPTPAAPDGLGPTTGREGTGGRSQGGRAARRRGRLGQSGQSRVYSPVRRPSHCNRPHYCSSFIYTDSRIAKGSGQR